MKREPITINESGNIIIQTINPSEIWMNEPELISFFNVIAPTSEQQSGLFIRKVH